MLSNRWELGFVEHRIIHVVQDFMFAIHLDWVLFFPLASRWWCISALENLRHQGWMQICQEGGIWCERVSLDKGSRSMRVYATLQSLAVLWHYLISLRCLLFGSTYVVMVRIVREGHKHSWSMCMHSKLNYLKYLAVLPRNTQGK